MEWKTGDWVVFDLDIGQIKEMRENGISSFSDGHCETSGQLTDRYRPLTLRNKRITEFFDIYYNRLREIDGESGFNYPDIHRYFASLCRQAIDTEGSEPFDKAQEFIREARIYKSMIHGVPLFRPKLHVAR